MAFERTLKDIALIVGGRVLGDASIIIRGIAGIEEARRGDITFAANPRYLKYLAGTKASAVIVSEEGAEAAIKKGKNLVVARDPYFALAVLLKELIPAERPAPGIHPSAEIHPSVKTGRDVSVRAHAVIEEGSSIGDGTVIYPGVYIGPSVTIGDSTVIYSNCSIREGSRIGSRVIIHCNSVIGSDGFGYAKEGSKYLKIPQRGTVNIGDDVEIGACVAVDRATFGETVIGRGTKIDNLVQIAHNVSIGTDTVIVAQVGISGSTRIGNRVTLAGQTGVAGHIEIADDCTIGAKSGVSNTLKEKGTYTGYPPVPHNEWLKKQAVFARLPEMKKKLDAVEKRLEELEKEALKRIKKK
ncbi:MAG: UDP-3-O-(3-hydroxymyristoyl)glucosamine N-acyltransferase [Deltaproteobacteria bacterium]|nr:UDP-3-O-(3-hydroxymyristoyl)glucosamine N-acyltransferase [Deltaproteobacteria bacterium]